MRLSPHVVQHGRIPNTDGLRISPQKRSPRGSEAAFVVFVLATLLPCGYSKRPQLHGLVPTSHQSLYLATKLSLG